MSLPEAHPSPRSEFGKRLRSVLSTRHWTVRDAADKIGVSPQQVGNWIKRPGAPDADSVARISQGLGCEVEFLVTGHGRMFKTDPLLENAQEALRIRGGDWTKVTCNTFMRMAEVAPYDFTLGDWINLGDDLDRTIRLDMKKEVDSVT